MGDSAMMFRVRWWIESCEDTRRIFDRLNTALQHALDEAGIEMPNPVHSLQIRIEPETADRLSLALREPGEGVRWERSHMPQDTGATNLVEGTLARHKRTALEEVPWIPFLHSSC
jgi:hypothetical protein